MSSGSSTVVRRRQPTASATALAVGGSCAGAPLCRRECCAVHRCIATRPNPVGLLLACVLRLGCGAEEELLQRECMTLRSMDAGTLYLDDDDDEAQTFRGYKTPSGYVGTFSLPR